jgi:hypothetical protein
MTLDLNNVLSFPPRTYCATLFEANEFKVAGTLDGYIDFAVPGYKTFQLSMDEINDLVSALNGAAADVRCNCLYDRDVLLNG